MLGGGKMFRLSSKKKKQTFCSIPDFIHTMKKSSDFSSYNIIEDGTLCLFYYKSTVESLIIKRFILAPIKNKLDEIQHIERMGNFADANILSLFFRIFFFTTASSKCEDS